MYKPVRNFLKHCPVSQQVHRPTVIEEKVRQNTKYIPERVGKIIVNDFINGQRVIYRLYNNVIYCVEVTDF